MAVNPRTCVETFTVTSTGAVVGGTGIFEKAAGTFAGTLIAKGLAHRKADGTCDETAQPPMDIDYITEKVTLSF